MNSIWPVKMLSITPKDLILGDSPNQQHVQKTRLVLIWSIWMSSAYMAEDSPGWLQIPQFHNDWSSQHGLQLASMAHKWLL